MRVASSEKRVKLTDSVRYREGLGERALFEEFKRWALSSSVQALQTRLSRPILPACASSDMLCTCDDTESPVVCALG